MEKPGLLKFTLESTLDYSDRLEQYVIVLDRKEEAQELRDYVAALENKLSDIKQSRDDYYTLSQGFYEQLKQEEAQNKELKAALREACGWNWLDHERAVEEDDADNLVPYTVRKQIDDALGS